MGLIEVAHQGGAGPPLVLLHGLTASWRIWLPVLTALERRHTVFAPTLAGHRGGPPLELAAGGVPALCDALERTLDEAGIGVAHLVGNSLGGWLALELAARGRAESVVVFSPLGRGRSPRDVRRLVRTFRLYDGRLAPHRDRLARGVRRPGVRRILLRNAMVHPERMPADAAVSLIDDMIATTILSGFADWMENAPPWTADLAADLPVRIAWGERDRQLPFATFGAPWLDALPRAELVELSGCGHVPMYDDPRLVVETILAVTTAHRPEPA